MTEYKGSNSEGNRARRLELDRSRAQNELANKKKEIMDEVTSGWLLCTRPFVKQAHLCLHRLKEKSKELAPSSPASPIAAKKC